VLSEHPPISAPRPAEGAGTDPPGPVPVVGENAAGAPGRRRFRDIYASAGVPATPAPRVPRAPISPRTLEELLHPTFRRLRFPDVLEREFEADSAADRTRHIRTIVVVAMIVYGLFCAVDYFVLPDVFGLSLLTRLVVEPLMAFALLLPHRGAPPWVRESIFMADTVVVGASIILVVYSSQAPPALYEHATVLLVPMFAAISARLRFPYALGACLFHLLLYIGFGLFYPHHTPPIAVLAQATVLAGTTVFALVANYELELKERRSYLLARLGEMQRDALAEANRRLETLSGSDELTGIANRRRFESEFALAWAQAIADGTPLSLVIVDVDFFKLYNDTYGHPQGDACLQAFAKILQQAADRRGGCAARLGGEEFAMLLPRSDVQRAKRIAESLCAEVRALGLPHRRSTVASSVTVSVGAATIAPTRSDQQRSILLAAADRALYRSKSEGRDRATHAAFADLPDDHLG